MQEINNLLKRFLGFLLSCHILEKDSCFFLDVGFGTALADSHDSAATAFVHPAHEVQQHEKQNYGRKQDTDHGRNKFTHHIRRLIFEDNVFALKTCRQCTGVLHLVDLVAFFLVRFLKFWNDCQHSGLECHFFDLIFIYHFDKFIICDLTGFIAHHICHKTQTN